MATSPFPAEAPPHHKIVVVNIGKKRSGQVKKLIKGQGKLMTRVTQVMTDLEASGQVAAGTSGVVIVVERKKKKDKVQARRFY